MSNLGSAVDRDRDLNTASAQRVSRWNVPRPPPLGESEALGPTLMKSSRRIRLPELPFELTWEMKPES